MKTTHIHWFRNDLRLTDQPFTTIIEGKKHFFGVYIIDPRNYQRQVHGFRKTGLLRLQFLREHLNDLQDSLRALGSELIVKVGFPEDIIPALSSHFEASISYMLESATEERTIQERVSKQLKTTENYAYWGNFLELPMHLNWTNNQFPNGFSGFRKKLEYHTKRKQWQTIPMPKSMPPSPVAGVTLKKSTRSIDARSAFQLRGGEQSALKQVFDYFERTQQVLHYKTTRNGLVGMEFSSKFSPFLALGAISPNYIVQQLKQFEEKFGSNQGTYWLWFELLWREYFRHAGWHFGDKIFYHRGLFNKKVSQRSNSILANDWMTGKTDEDFINAGLIELQTTGYTSNRMRQNIASYLIHNLGINWQFGAAWFEHQLLDYDVYSNQGNWMYITGVAFDPKGGRAFDIPFQQERYDTNGGFRAIWLK